MSGRQIISKRESLYGDTSLLLGTTGKDFREETISEADSSSCFATSSRSSWRRLRTSSSCESTTREELTEEGCSPYPNSRFMEVFEQILSEFLEIKDGSDKKAYEKLLRLTDRLLSEEIDYSGDQWIFKAQVLWFRMALQQEMGDLQGASEDYLALTDLGLTHPLYLADSEMSKDFLGFVGLDRNEIALRGGDYVKESLSFLFFNRALVFFTQGEEEKGLSALREAASQRNHTAVLAALLLYAKTGERMENKESSFWRDPAQAYFWQGSYRDILENIWGAWPSDQLGADDMYYAWRGAAHCMLGEYEAAGEEYKKAMTVYAKKAYPPQIPFAHQISLAMVHFMSGNSSAALEGLEELQQKPKGRPSNESEWYKWSFSAGLLELVLAHSAR